jgi:choline dehydrogenase-like flavoprotein
MIIDVRSDFPPEASVDCDVCIVGAGPAGMAVAMELADTGHRICLLEAGGMRYEAAVQQFNEGHVVGNRYPPLRNTRLSAFGGSSMLWAGWCRPLDPIDFEPRTWVANSGWPFDLDELRPHYRRAHDVCRLGPFEYEVEPWQALGAGAPLSMAGDSVRTTVFHVNPLRFGTEFRSQFEKAAHVRVLLDSPALRLHSESGDRRVASLTAVGPARSEFRVRARYFVLAGGGIENARILLLSGDTPERSVGNQRGLVGRYFTEHPFIHPGYLIPADPRRSLAFYLPMTPGSAPPGASVRMTFSLTRDALERERLLNGTFVVRPAYEGHPVFDSPEVRSMLEVWEKLRGRGVPGGAWSELTTAARAPHRLALAAWRKLTIRGTASPRWALRAFFEAESLATNRVTLSEELDSLGRPLPHVEWRLGELDVESMRRGFHLLDAELRKAGLGRLELRFADDLEHWNREAFGGKHHMGTTRMHPSPDRGVVDADGKVHGIANLFVAGSSVFPTAGFANPTLTIVALSSRLGLHLRRLLAGGETLRVQ